MLLSRYKVSLRDASTFPWHQASEILHMMPNQSQLVRNQGSVQAGWLHTNSLLNEISNIALCHICLSRLTKVLQVTA